jgi:hypothetical protein
MYIYLHADTDTCFRENASTLEILLSAEKGRGSPATPFTPTNWMEVYYWQVRRGGELKYCTVMPAFSRWTQA